MTQNRIEIAKKPPTPIPTPTPTSVRSLLSDETFETAAAADWDAAAAENDDCNDATKTDMAGSDDVKVGVADAISMSDLTVVEDD